MMFYLSWFRIQFERQIIFLSIIVPRADSKISTILPMIRDLPLFGMQDSSKHSYIRDCNHLRQIGYICIVCSSLIYGFWLPLWYFQAMVVLVHIWFQNAQLLYRTIPPIVPIGSRFVTIFWVLNYHTVNFKLKYQNEERGENDTPYTDIHDPHFPRLVQTLQ